mmetsp:Transcript_3022/g.7512  ORF Transcript_3022/g.7512 Transcript_3022/m.7512 type:complete len:333 (+) Transcript_3022:773-1771(+)
MLRGNDHAALLSIRWLLLLLRLLGLLQRCLLGTPHLVCSCLLLIDAQFLLLLLLLRAAALVVAPGPGRALLRLIGHGRGHATGQHHVALRQPPLMLKHHGHQHLGRGRVHRRAQRKPRVDEAHKHDHGGGQQEQQHNDAPVDGAGGSVDERPVNVGEAAGGGRRDGLRVGKQVIHGRVGVSVLLLPEQHCRLLHHLLSHLSVGLRAGTVRRGARGHERVEHRLALHLLLHSGHHLGALSHLGLHGAVRRADAAQQQPVQQLRQRGQRPGKHNVPAANSCAAIHRAAICLIRVLLRYVVGGARTLLRGGGGGARGVDGVLERTRALRVGQLAA